MYLQTKIRVCDKNKISTSEFQSCKLTSTSWAGVQSPLVVCWGLGFLLTFSPTLATTLRALVILGGRLSTMDEEETLRIIEVIRL